MPSIVSHFCLCGLPGLSCSQLKEYIAVQPTPTFEEIHKYFNGHPLKVLSDPPIVFFNPCQSYAAVVLRKTFLKIFTKLCGVSLLLRKYNLLTLKTSLSVWTRGSMQSTWISVSKNWQRCLFAIVARRLGTLQGVIERLIQQRIIAIPWIDRIDNIA